MNVLQQKSCAARHGPRCIERALSAVLERIAELLLRARKVTRGQADHTLRVPCRHAHTPQTQRFPAGRTCTIKPKQRNIIIHKPKRACDILSEQIACVQVTDIACLRPRLGQGERHCLLLKRTLCLLP